MALYSVEEFVFRNAVVTAYCKDYGVFDITYAVTKFFLLDAWKIFFYVVVVLVAYLVAAVLGAATRFPRMSA